MGELLKALKEGNMEKLSRLAKRMAQKTKRENVSESLRKIWEREDVEMTLRGDEVQHENEHEDLPDRWSFEQLKAHWKKEDEEFEKYKERSVVISDSLA